MSMKDKGSRHLREILDVFLLWRGNATTLGGLKVTTDLEVVNKDGQVINGLYAIGDTAGGVRGDDSVPGADVGWAITSGYLLGNILKTK